MIELSALREKLAPTSVGASFNLVGALFPRDYISIIAGQPGCGKTWFELRYALDVVRGGVCIGDPYYHGMPYKVLLLSGEASTEMLNHRAWLLGENDVQHNIVIYSQQSFSERNLDMSLTTALGRKMLAQLIDLEQPDLIFVDSFISFLSGDESSQADLSQSLVSLNNIAKHKHVAIVLIHHYRKRQQGQSSSRGMDDVIGSSALTRLAGVVVGLEVDSTKSPPIVYARCVKSWWKPFKTFSYAICNKAGSELVEVRQNYAVSPNGLTSSAREKLEAYILTLREPFTQSQVMEAMKVSQGTLSLTLGGMMERGLVRLIDKDGKINKYAVVDK